MAFSAAICNITFTFMHLADAFIQSDLQAIQAIHFVSVYSHDKICVNNSNKIKYIQITQGSEMVSIW